MITMQNYATPTIAISNQDDCLLRHVKDSVANADIIEWADDGFKPFLPCFRSHLPTSTTPRV